MPCYVMRTVQAWYPVYFQFTSWKHPCCRLLSYDPATQTASLVREVLQHGGSRRVRVSYADLQKIADCRQQ